MLQFGVHPLKSHELFHMQIPDQSNKNANLSSGDNFVPYPVFFSKTYTSNDFFLIGNFFAVEETLKFIQANQDKLERTTKEEMLESLANTLGDLNLKIERVNDILDLPTIDTVSMPQIHDEILINNPPDFQRIRSYMSEDNSMELAYSITEAATTNDRSPKLYWFAISAFFLVLTSLFTQNLAFLLLACMLILPWIVSRYKTRKRF